MEGGQEERSQHGSEWGKVGVEFKQFIYLKYIERKRS